jgi:hypothetical protein
MDVASCGFFDEMVCVIEGDVNEVDLLSSARFRDLQTVGLIESIRKAGLEIECIDGLWCEMSLGKPRIIVAQELRTGVIKMVHQLAHTGTKRTWVVVRDRFY